MSAHTARITVTFHKSGRPRSDQRLTSPGRTPRVARLLAFAHEIDRRVYAGELSDLAHAARAFGLTRARVTQVVNLLLVAPEIQASILEMLLAANGRDAVTERMLRPLLAEPVWQRQIAMWNEIKGRAAA